MKIGQPVAILVGEFAGSQGTIATIEYTVTLSDGQGTRVKVPVGGVAELKEAVFAATLVSGDSKSTPLLYVFNDRQEIILASVYTENIMNSLAMQFPYAELKFIGHYTDSILLLKTVKETIEAFKKARANV